MDRILTEKGLSICPVPITIVLYGFVLAENNSPFTVIVSAYVRYTV